MIELPLNHFRHLKRFADLRRCPLPEAIDFLFSAVESNSKNWIDERFGPAQETRRLDITGYSVEELMDRIQGLPSNIRPVTDGPYLEHFKFFSSEPGLLGIEAEGVRILDFDKATSRDIGVHALVKDLLPPMTAEEFRVYNTFNSQYLRLVRQPKLFTMPKRKAMAIDAGCYVGYKMLALAQFVDGAPVLGFELASDNFEVLSLNVANNPTFNLEGIRAALSNKSEDLKIHTRNERTMAHSLTSFTQLKEANTSLLKGGQSDTETEIIRTSLLDDYTRDVEQLSTVHISVNGHEPEVVLGGTETIRKADILRVSCPYSRDGRMVREMVVEGLASNGIEVFGLSGAAIIAGRSLKDYHAVPLAGPTTMQGNLGRAKSLLKAVQSKFMPPPA